MSEVEVNAALASEFNRPRSDGMYGVFITNSEGGTGTDFLSSPRIEENGGVRVVICTKPKSYGELC